VASTRPLRVGIIGLGFGIRHASTYAETPNARIVAMAEPDPTVLPVPFEEFCRHYGARPYRDGVKMLEEEQLDAVSVCTNPRLHRPMVEAAARQGVAVLVEKPMAGTVEDCDAMIAACERAGVPLHMEFPMRQLAPLVELRRVVDEGKLGRPILAVAEYVSGLRPADHPWIWKMGDGSSPINENTCHIIDTVCFLLRDADRVRAEGGNFAGRGAPAPDGAVCTLHFRSGAVAALSGGAIATDEMAVRPRLSLYGTEGQAYVEGIYHEFHRLVWARRGGPVVDRDYGGPKTLIYKEGPYAAYSLIQPSLASFVDNVLHDRPPAVTGREGRENVRICLAIVESIHTGKTIELRGPEVRS
jgi:predicted dehydrogenase